METDWPTILNIGQYNPDNDKLFNVLRIFVNKVLNIRSEFKVTKNCNLQVLIFQGNPIDNVSVVDYIKNNLLPIKKLCKIDKIKYDAEDIPKKSLKFELDDIIFYVEVNKYFNFESKIKSLQKKVEDVNKKKTKINGFLKKSENISNKKKQHFGKIIKKCDDDIIEINEQLNFYNKL
jgi:valyl-tRNA synthetase